MASALMPSRIRINATTFTYPNLPGNPDSTQPKSALIVEGVLFESGRPVFVVPYVQKTGLTLNRAMVCWDGSRNAARAVSDALPLLARTENVDVVTIIGERGKSDELPGVDIAPTPRPPWT